MTMREACILPFIALLAGCAMDVARAGVPSQTRTYYIAADEVPWDYVAGGVDGIMGKPFKAIGYFKTPKNPYTEKEVSTQYRKVLYREYTDSTFQTLKPRPPEWEHLGFLGPLVRGVVGDTIKIVFRNNAKQPYAVHPHGVFYNKDSEGAVYSDSTSGADKADDGVPPGATHVYTWPVPERAGPAMGDNSSVVWMYHSHHDEVKDVNTGLMGPMVITARGKAKPDGSPADVDREFVAAFMQVHEEDSWLAGENIGANFQTVNGAMPGVSQNFYPYFLLFSINGFSHGSLPTKAFTMKKGEHVRWYLFGSTNDFDAHAPHWHGNSVVINHMRSDVASMNPMEMVIADMTPDNVGTWLFHCHISFHFTEGMGTRYVVTE